MPWSRWCHWETSMVNGFLCIASGCGQSLTGSGAQTAGDNVKYHYTFLDFNELCYLFAILDFQNFWKLIFADIILFSSFCLHTVPTKTCHFMVSFWSWINHWTTEKNKKCVLSINIFLIVVFQSITSYKAIYWIMKWFLTLNPNQWWKKKTEKTEGFFEDNSTYT